MLATFFSHSNSVELCPAGWIPSDASGTCIKLYHTKLSWQDARQHCKAEGGEDLVTILDPAMNQFIVGKRAVSTSHILTFPLSLSLYHSSHLSLHLSFSLFLSLNLPYLSFAISLSLCLSLSLSLSLSPSIPLISLFCYFLLSQSPVSLYIAISLYISISLFQLPLSLSIAISLP